MNFFCSHPGHKSVWGIHVRQSHPGHHQSLDDGPSLFPLQNSNWRQVRESWVIRYTFIKPFFGRYKDIQSCFEILEPEVWEKPLLQSYLPSGFPLSSLLKFLFADYPFLIHWGTLSASTPQGSDAAAYMKDHEHVFLGIRCECSSRGPVWLRVHHSHQQLRTNIILQLDLDQDSKEWE